MSEGTLDFGFGKPANWPPKRAPRHDCPGCGLVSVPQLGRLCPPCAAAASHVLARNLEAELSAQGKADFLPLCQACAGQPYTHRLLVNDEERVQIRCARCSRMTMHYATEEMAKADWRQMQRGGGGAAFDE